MNGNWKTFRFGSALPHGGARIETPWMDVLVFMVASSALPHGGARIETRVIGKIPTLREVAPSLTGGRGLKLEAVLQLVEALE